MKIQIGNDQKLIQIDRRKIRSVITKLCKHLDCTGKEISLTFVSDARIQELNREYRDKNKPTDVLSFSLQEGEFSEINPDILGDIVISVETAKKNAQKNGLSLEQEINFLIIHGLLHLLGYNHENTTKGEAGKMRRKEKELLNVLEPPHQSLPDK
ncbi:MAG: rRNA maturation RNase YbeY [Smithellaceae bacterium]|jgi:probable rRNA maturation factor